jgi:hypothetical protein
MKLVPVLLLLGLAAACGRSTLIELGDSGGSDNLSSDDAGGGGGGTFGGGGTGTAGGGEGGSANGGEAGSAGGGEGGPANGGEGGTAGEAGTTHRGEGGTTGGARYVDAGYYYGDGSYFVDGGAYPDVATPPDASGGTDAGVVDAAPGCGALAACCPTLTSASQSLCTSVVSAGNAANCATELAELQNEGDCTGVAILASQVQVTPNYLVSDGSLLFWTTSATPGLLAMPVKGGRITTLLTGPITNDIGPFTEGTPFLAVDDVNVYILQNAGITRIPKNGGPATLVNESGGEVYAATSLGSIAYWVESAPGGGCGGCIEVAVKSAPLLGGAVSLAATVEFPEPDINDVAVTPNKIFIGFSSLFEFSTGAGASGKGSMITTGQPNFLTSDNGAVYCAETSGSNLRIASDGTATALGPAVSSSYIVFDDTYAYWADMTTVGTIMRAAKAGGGTATVLAYDTSPTAIAVDSNSVYWADQGGYIKSMPK